MKHYHAGGLFEYRLFVYQLKDWFKELVARLAEIRDGYAPYEMRMVAGPHRLAIPVRPMVGCIGTAPDLEVPRAGTAGSRLSRR